MNDEYSLDANKNCSNCEHCDKTSEEYPYICTLNGAHTGMWIKCDAWNEDVKYCKLCETKLAKADIYGYCSKCAEAANYDP